jgi:hypothetical protein
MHNKFNPIDAQELELEGSSKVQIRIMKSCRDFVLKLTVNASYVMTIVTIEVFFIP